MFDKARKHKNDKYVYLTINLESLSAHRIRITRSIVSIPTTINITITFDIEYSISTKSTISRKSARIEKNNSSCLTINHRSLYAHRIRITIPSIVDMTISIYIERIVSITRNSAQRRENLIKHV